jgi:uncharacterized lipoprotein NlpE involved in copper resistance
MATTYRTSPPTTSASEARTARPADPHELSGTHGPFTWQATTTGYRILHDGVEVALGTGNATARTNAQRAIQALVNRGVVPT